MVRETRTIPIAFVVVSDPVGDGFVTSMARPGGNVTGFTNVEASLGGKWLQLLKEMRPGLSRVAALYNPEGGPRRRRCVPVKFELILNVKAARALASPFRICFWCVPTG